MMPSRSISKHAPILAQYMTGIATLIRKYWAEKWMPRFTEHICEPFGWKGDYLSIKINMEQDVFNLSLKFYHHFTLNCPG